LELGWWFPQSSFVKKLGLIAGNGRFPLLFAAEAKREGYTVIAVAHRGETSEEIERWADEVTWIRIGQLGKLIAAFRSADVRQAVMAGGIRKVNLFGNFRPDLRGVAFLARIRSREDDALLRGVADELASEGIAVMESTLCLPHIFAEEGVLTPRHPSASQWDDIRLGFRTAKEIGRLGIGQTVVVKDGVVMAVEAVEGTDAAIARGGSMSRAGCVVVKVSKPGQDLRFDVPAVGPETIKTLHEAKGAVLAVEAEKTILLDRDGLLQEASRCGVVVASVRG
jgi:DUF1009 family protein